MKNGNKTAAWILMAIGAANILYGVYRTLDGREGSIVLFGVGAMGLAFGAVLLNSTSK